MTSHDKFIESRYCYITPGVWVRDNYNVHYCEIKPNMLMQDPDKKQSTSNKC